MQPLRRLVVFSLCTSMTAVSGCLDFDILGDEPIRPGQTQQFQVKASNSSACPVFERGTSADNVNIMPLLPRSAIEAIEGEEGLIIGIICGLIPPPDDFSAMLASMETPEETLRAIAYGAAQSAQTASCSGTGVSCGPLPPGPDTPPGGISCTIPTLGPGEMATLDCEAPVPSSAAGTLYTLVQSRLCPEGVCKAGPGQGNACDADSDCGMGGVCAPGICDGGANDGNGCDSTAMPSECPDGECTTCSETAIGLTCRPFQVLAPAQAPAVGPWGLAVALVALAALGGYALRARRLRGTGR